MLCANQHRQNNYKISYVMSNDSAKKKILVIEENAFFFLEWRFTNDVDFLNTEQHSLEMLIEVSTVKKETSYQNKVPIMSSVFF